MTLVVKCYPFAEIQSVYSLVQANWAISMTNREGAVLAPSKNYIDTADQGLTLAHADISMK